MTKFIYRHSGDAGLCAKKAESRTVAVLLKGSMISAFVTAVLNVRGLS